MKAKVCSAFSDADLENKIQRAIDEGEDRGFVLTQVSYSVATTGTATTLRTPNKDNYFRSAVLIFDHVKR